MKDRQYSTMEILCSAFGLGTYRQDSDARYKKVMQQADENIKESEIALARSAEALRAAEQVLKRK